MLVLLLTWRIVKISVLRCEMSLDVHEGVGLEKKLSDFDKWKKDVITDLDKFEQWLEKNGGVGIEDSLRFYELKEQLRTGSLNVAFVGEFSRGKSELINALFFSEKNGRLLPTGIGRTTMCPVEIYFDEKEEPMLQLLSIDSRLTGAPISQLKQSSVEWTRIRLPMNEEEGLRRALEKLTETKRVSASEAQLLGLIPYKELSDNAETVDVPLWRYARLNYPHSLLAHGVRILDTPGLNALGVEPELTLATIPSAQAVIFILGVDTGVTASDLQVWKTHIQGKLLEKVVVINKIDLLMDVDRPVADKLSIDRVVADTARTLGVPRERIFALSALKGVAARMEKSAEDWSSSGVVHLEAFFSKFLVPHQQQVLVGALRHMIGNLLESGLDVCEKKLAVNKKMESRLLEIHHQGKEKALSYWTDVVKKKEIFNDVQMTFRTRRSLVNQHRDRICGLLGPNRLMDICHGALSAMEGSWTTPGLTAAMRKLIAAIDFEFSAVRNACEEALKMLNETYEQFSVRYGYQLRRVPPVGLTKYVKHLGSLLKETEVFCNDPVNIVLIEKRFMIERFWNTFVTQAEFVFKDASREVERWFAAVLTPVEIRMRAEKNALEQQVSVLQNIRDRASSIDAEMIRLRAMQVALVEEKRVISDLLNTHEEPVRALAEARRTDSSLNFALAAE